LENVNNIFPIGSSLQKELEDAVPEKRGEMLVEEAKRQYTKKEEEAGGGDNFRQAERAVLLRVMDILWMEHIDAMTKMRESIGLQGYGQRDPLVEYKQEAYAMFQRLQGAMAFDTARLIYKVKIVSSADNNDQAPNNKLQSGPQSLRGTGDEAISELGEKKKLALQGAEEPTGDFKDEAKELATSHEPQATSDGSGAVRDPQAKKDDKIGRNDPCHCGSGKKFKKCHGK